MPCLNVQKITRALLISLTITLLTACGGADNDSSTTRSSSSVRSVSSSTSSEVSSSSEESSSSTVSSSSSVVSSSSSEESSSSVVSSSSTVASSSIVSSESSSSSEESSSSEFSSSSSSTPENILPAANAGADITIIEGNTVLLNGSASEDSDGSIVAYLWQQTGGPAVTLDFDALMNSTFTTPISGSTTTLTFTLTVTDNDNAQNSDSIDITVYPKTTAGFTEFTKSEDTLVYYVSDDGNDDNDGLSPENALKTPYAGLTKIRTGFPDWVLFRSGDSFPEIGKIDFSGRSMEEPALLGAYGYSIERPSFNGGFYTNGSGGAATSNDYIVFVGLEFLKPQADPEAADHDPSAGGGYVSWLRGTKGVWIEDCRFRFGGLGFSTRSDGFPIENVTLYRSQVLDSYKVGITTGLFAYGTNNFTINETLIDNNGWNEDVPGADSSIKSHNIYFQVGTTNSTIKNSIVMRASSHGVMFRSGGTVTNNFLYHNPINILLGGGSADQPTNMCGLARDNVILEGVDMNTGESRGWGIMLEIDSTFDGNDVTVEDNLLANCIASTGGPNCYNISVVIEPFVAGQPGVTLSNNTIQNWTRNGYDGIPPNTLNGYLATLDGIDTEEEFFAALRAQSKFNWNEDLTAEKINAYFREALID